MDPGEIMRMTLGLCRCDETEWRRFHEIYYPFLSASVRARGVPDAEVSEIVQRIYLRVLRHARRFESANAFEAWLHCLARCEVVDAARRNRRRTWLGERFQQWSLTRAGTADSGTIRHLHEALEKLPAADRHLVSRHYLEGWSQDELADETGLSVKAVECRLARLRRLLRKILTQPGPC
jgi:RNA polymerase sigma-70 factor, ECF subfamily